jgi:hypothetical protein
MSNKNPLLSSNPHLLPTLNKIGAVFIGHTYNDRHNPKVLRENWMLNGVQVQLYLEPGRLNFISTALEMERTEVWAPKSELFRFRRFAGIDKFCSLPLVEKVVNYVFGIDPQVEDVYVPYGALPVDKEPSDV